MGSRKERSLTRLPRELSAKEAMHFRPYSPEQLSMELPPTNSEGYGSHSLMRVSKKLPVTEVEEYGPRWVTAATEGTISNARWNHEWNQVRAKWHPQYLFRWDGLDNPGFWDHDNIYQDCIVPVPTIPSNGLWRNGDSRTGESFLPSETTSGRYRERRKDRRACTLFLIAVGIILSAAAAIPVLLHVFKSTDSKTEIIGRVSSELTLVRINYIEALGNTSSIAFKVLSDEFEHEIAHLYLNASSKRYFRKAKVNSFRNGSVHVDYDMYFNVIDKKMPSRTELRTILYSVDRDREDSGLGVLGDLRFRIASAQIKDIGTIVIDAKKHSFINPELKSDQSINIDIQTENVTTESNILANKTQVSNTTILRTEHSNGNGNTTPTSDIDKVNHTDDLRLKTTMYDRQYNEMNSYHDTTTKESFQTKAYPHDTTEPGSETELGRNNILRALDGLFDMTNRLAERTTVDISTQAMEINSTKPAPFSKELEYVLNGLNRRKGMTIDNDKTANILQELSNVSVPESDQWDTFSNVIEDFTFEDIGDRFTTDQTPFDNLLKTTSLNIPFQKSNKPVWKPTIPTSTEYLTKAQNGIIKPLYKPFTTVAASAQVTAKNITSSHPGDTGNRYEHHSTPTVGKTITDLQSTQNYNNVNTPDYGSLYNIYFGTATTTSNITEKTEMDLSNKYDRKFLQGRPAEQSTTDVYSDNNMNLVLSSSATGHADLYEKATTPGQDDNESLNSFEFQTIQHTTRTLPRALQTLTTSALKFSATEYPSDVIDEKSAEANLNPVYVDRTSASVSVNRLDDALVTSTIRPQSHETSSMKESNLEGSVTAKTELYFENIATDQNKITNALGTTTQLTGTRTVLPENNITVTGLSNTSTTATQTRDFMWVSALDWFGFETSTSSPTSVYTASSSPSSILSESSSSFEREASVVPTVDSIHSNSIKQSLQSDEKTFHQNIPVEYLFLTTTLPISTTKTNPRNTTTYHTNPSQLLLETTPSAKTSVKPAENQTTEVQNIRRAEDTVFLSKHTPSLVSTLPASQISTSDIATKPFESYSTKMLNTMVDHTSLSPPAIDSSNETFDTSKSEFNDPGTNAKLNDIDILFNGDTTEDLLNLSYFDSFKTSDSSIVLTTVSSLPGKFISSVSNDNLTVTESTDQAPAANNGFQSTNEPVKYFGDDSAITEKTTLLHSPTHVVFETYTQSYQTSTSYLQEENIPDKIANTLNIKENLSTISANNFSDSDSLNVAQTPRWWIKQSASNNGTLYPFNNSSNSTEFPMSIQSSTLGFRKANTNASIFEKNKRTNYPQSLTVYTTRLMKTMPIGRNEIIEDTQSSTENGIDVSTDGSTRKEIMHAGVTASSSIHSTGNIRTDVLDTTDIIRADRTVSTGTLFEEVGATTDTFFEYESASTDVYPKRIETTIDTASTYMNESPKVDRITLSNENSSEYVSTSLGTLNEEIGTTNNTASVYVRASEDVVSAGIDTTNDTYVSESTDTVSEEIGETTVTPSAYFSTSAYIGSSANIGSSRVAGHETIGIKNETSLTYINAPTELVTVGTTKVPNQVDTQTKMGPADGILSKEILASSSTEMVSTEGFTLDFPDYEFATTDSVFTNQNAFSDSTTLNVDVSKSNPTSGLMSTMNAVSTMEKGLMDTKQADLVPTTEITHASTDILLNTTLPTTDTYIGSSRDASQGTIDITNQKSSAYVNESTESVTKYIDTTTDIYNAYIGSSPDTVNDYAWAANNTPTAYESVSNKNFIESQTVAYGPTTSVLTNDDAYTNIGITQLETSTSDSSTPDGYQSTAKISDTITDTIFTNETKTKESVPGKVNTTPNTTQSSEDTVPDFVNIVGTTKVPTKVEPQTDTGPADIILSTEILPLVANSSTIVISTEGLTLTFPDYEFAKTDSVFRDQNTFSDSTTPNGQLSTNNPPSGLILTINTVSTMANELTDTKQADFLTTTVIDHASTGILLNTTLPTTDTYIGSLKDAAHKTIGITNKPFSGYVSVSTEFVTKDIGTSTTPDAVNGYATSVNNTSTSYGSVSYKNFIDSQKVEGVQTTAVFTYNDTYTNIGITKTETSTSDSLTLNGNQSTDIASDALTDTIPQNETKTIEGVFAEINTTPNSTISSKDIVSDLVNTMGTTNVRTKVETQTNTGPADVILSTEILPLVANSSAEMVSTEDFTLTFPDYETATTDSVITNQNVFTDSTSTNDDLSTINPPSGLISTMHMLSTMAEELMDTKQIDLVPTTEIVHASTDILLNTTFTTTDTVSSDSINIVSTYSNASIDIFPREENTPTVTQPTYIIRDVSRDTSLSTGVTTLRSIMPTEENGLNNTNTKITELVNDITSVSGSSKEPRAIDKTDPIRIVKEGSWSVIMENDVTNNITPIERNRLSETTDHTLSYKEAMEISPSDQHKFNKRTTEDIHVVADSSTLVNKPIPENSDEVTQTITPGQNLTSALIGNDIGIKNEQVNDTTTKTTLKGENVDNLYFDITTEITLNNKRDEEKPGNIVNFSDNRNIPIELERNTTMDYIPSTAEYLESSTVIQPMNISNTDSTNTTVAFVSAQSTLVQTSSLLTSPTDALNVDMSTTEAFVWSDTITSFTTMHSNENTALNATDSPLQTTITIAQEDKVTNKGIPGMRWRILETSSPILSASAITSTLTQPETKIMSSPSPTSTFKPGFKYLWSLGEDVLGNLIAQPKEIVQPDTHWRDGQLSDPNKTFEIQTTVIPTRKYLSIDNDDIQPKETYDAFENNDTNGLPISPLTMITPAHIDSTWAKSVNESSFGTSYQPDVSTYLTTTQGYETLIPRQNIKSSSNFTAFAFTTTYTDVVRKDTVTMASASAAINNVSSISPIVNGETITPPPMFVESERQHQINEIQAVDKRLNREDSSLSEGDSSTSRTYVETETTTTVNETSETPTNLPEIRFLQSVDAYVGYPLSLAWSITRLTDWSYVAVQRYYQTGLSEIIGIINGTSMLLSDGDSDLKLSRNTVISRDSIAIYIEIPAVRCEDEAAYIVRVIYGNIDIASKSNYIQIWREPQARVVSADNVFENGTVDIVQCQADLGYPLGRLFMRLSVDGGRTFTNSYITSDVMNPLTESSCIKIVSVSFSNSFLPNSVVNNTQVQCGIYGSSAIRTQSGVVMSEIQTINIIPESACENVNGTLIAHPFRSCGYINCEAREASECPRDECFNTQTQTCAIL